MSIDTDTPRLDAMAFKTTAGIEVVRLSDAQPIERELAMAIEMVKIVRRMTEPCCAICGQSLEGEEWTDDNEYGDAHTKCLEDKRGV